MRARPFLDVGLSMLAVAACGSDVPLGGAGADGGAPPSGVDATAPDGRGDGQAGADGGPSDAAGGSTGDSSGGAGAPSVVATFADVKVCLGRMVVDAASVYVVTLGTGEFVYSAPLAGGPTTEVRAGGGVMLAITSTTAYTADYYCGGGATIWGCPKSGCVSLTTSTIWNGDGCMSDLAADDAYVYWAAWRETGDAGPLSTVGAVGKVPFDGGPFTVLGTARNPMSIALVGDTLFYTDLETSSVMSVPIDGGTSTTVAQVPNGLLLKAVTADATNVYFGTHDGSVFEVPRSGGTPTTLVPGMHVDDGGGIFVDGGAVWGMGDQMAVDADRVYFRMAGGINAVPIGGGPVTTLATSSSWDCGVGLAIDSTHVYWTQQNKVMRVAK
jgi:hypothetical protein